MRRKKIGKHLNKRELLSARLLVKYFDKRPPDADTKKKLIVASGVACNVMLRTVWAIDKVCLFHTDESKVTTEVLDKHFCFQNRTKVLSTRDSKQKLVNAKDRRKWLGEIRKNMLSISFHLNTGMYLLDTDAGFRTIVGDNEIDAMDQAWSEEEVYDASGNVVADPSDPTQPLMQSKTNVAGKRVLSKNIEAYANTGTSGPVHVSFELAKTYSPVQFARLIIHEASHTYCGTSDVRYAHASDYYTQKPEDMMWNADSYGYAACSIAAKTCFTYDSLQGAVYT
jgi:hypothetical protein